MWVLLLYWQARDTANRSEPYGTRPFKEEPHHEKTDSLHDECGARGRGSRAPGVTGVSVGQGAALLTANDGTVERPAAPSRGGNHEGFQRWVGWPVQPDATQPGHRRPHRQASELFAVSHLGPTQVE